MEKIKSVNGTMTFLFAVLVNLAVQFIAAVIMNVGNALGADLGNSATFNFILMFLIQLGFLFVFYLTVIKPKRELCVGFKNKINYASVSLAPVIAALCICTFYIPTFWFVFGLNKAGYNPPADVTMATPIEFVLGSFVLCVAAPIGEELVFRGALLSGLRSKYGVVPSVLLSGLAFMLMHMNPAQTVYQFCLGCVCAIVALATGSVLPAMIIHSFSNMFAILIDYTALGTLIEKLMLFMYSHAGYAVLITVACVAVFGFAIIVCVYFTKKLNDKKSETEETLSLEKEPLASKPVLDENGDKTIERHKNAVSVLESKDKLIYAIAGGVCGFMWILSLIAGFIA